MNKKLLTLIALTVMGGATTAHAGTFDLSAQMDSVHAEMNEIFHERATQVEEQVVHAEEQVISTHNGFTVSSKKEAIAMSESGGDYNARNGQYIGKYQLTDSYLGGDYSPANQELVFDNYCSSRYGGIDGAWEHWRTYGWY